MTRTKEIGVLKAQLVRQLVSEGFTKREITDVVSDGIVGLKG